MQISGDGYVLVNLPTNQDPWYPMEDLERADAEEEGVMRSGLQSWRRPQYRMMTWLLFPHII